MVSTNAGCLTAPQASPQPTRPAPTTFESWLPMDSEARNKSNCNARIGFWRGLAKVVDDRGNPLFVLRLPMPKPVQGTLLAGE